MKTTPILMSADNPDGWKLEDLCAQLQREVLAKNQRIDGDNREQALRTAARNRRIIQLLGNIVSMQQDIMADLATLGPDDGPLGRPRIGKGSDQSEPAEKDLFDPCGR